ncbi:hypothetical protein [uncultured Sulfuricurvum sp.]|uniref:hypothetical protein n=1 Tax=uncultured Sulfuricurvum sp. TaxID=430693 RepID=UPI0026154BC6|nr:hypothetical protein [uncultured Sulfuricurvum sp.]
MKKITVLLVFCFSMIAFGSVEPNTVKLHVKHNCVVKNDKPFQNASEYHRFNVTVEQASLPDRKENIKQIAIWADGQLYAIRDLTPIVLPQAGNRSYDPLLSEDELIFIANAHFSKLKISYEPSVDERQSAKDDTTPYFTSVKTTIEKEEFLPMTLERNEIDQAIKECHDTIEYEKNFQLFTEIAIGTLAILVFTGTFYYLWRRKKRKSLSESA